MDIKKFIKFVCLFLFQMLFSYVVIYVLKLFGVDISTLYFDWLIWLSFFISLISLIIVCLIYWKTIVNDIKDYVKNFKKYFSFSLKCWLCGLVLMIIANVAIYMVLGNISKNEEEVQLILSASPLYMFFSSVIYAPLLEELIYRKSVKDFINNKWIYVIASGLIFGFVHTTAGLFTNSGAFNFGEMIYIIPYGIVGSCFAYLYSKTNNIFCSVVMHAFHNFLAFLVSIMPLFFEVIL